MQLVKLQIDFLVIVEEQPQTNHLLQILQFIANFSFLLLLRKNLLVITELIQVKEFHFED